MARKKLETLTEQMFYVLLALRRERHGYGIMQAVDTLTRGRVKIGAGTLYALLERFEGERFITLTRTEEKRKYYRLTAKGQRLLGEKAAEWKAFSQGVEKVVSACTPQLQPEKA